MIRDYLFVLTQFLLFLAYVFDVAALGFPLPDVLGYFGLFLALAGLCTCGLALLQLNKNLSPFPTPVRAGELVTNGVYAYARHPIYSGILLFGLGYGLYLGSGYKLLITAALLVLFYFKSSYEERLLAERYKNYPAYRQRVGRFGPKV